MDLPDPLDAPVTRAVLEALVASESPMGPTEIARATGSTKGTVAQLLGRLVDRGQVRKVDRGLYTVPQSGDGRSDATPPEPQPAPGTGVRVTSGDRAPEGSDLVSYPYAPHGHAGNWAGRSNEGMEGAEMIVLSKSFLVGRIGRVPDPARTYWTHIVGESMLPWLRDGQMIGIEMSDEIRTDGRYALYFDDAEEEIIKRVSRLGGRRLRIAADNPAYGSQELQHVEDDLYRDSARQHTLRMRVLGRVIEPPDDAQSIFATAIAAVRGLTV